jgi:hypothetical protein
MRGARSLLLALVATCGAAAVAAATGLALQPRSAGGIARARKS